MNTNPTQVKPILNVWDVDGCMVEAVKLIFDQPNAEALNFETIKQTPLREAFIDTIFLPNYKRGDWVFTGRKQKRYRDLTYQLYYRIFLRKYLPAGAARFAKQLLQHTIFFPDEMEFGPENQIYHQWKYTTFHTFAKSNQSKYEIRTYDDDIKILELIAPILFKEGQLNLVGKNYCMQINTPIPIQPVKGG